MRRFANTVGADASKLSVRGTLHKNVAKSASTSSANPAVWFAYSGAATATLPNNPEHSQTCCIHLSVCLYLSICHTCSSQQGVNSAQIGTEFMLLSMPKTFHLSGETLGGVLNAVYVIFCLIAGWRKTLPAEPATEDGVESRTCMCFYFATKRQALLCLGRQWQPVAQDGHGALVRVSRVQQDTCGVREFPHAIWHRPSCSL